MSTSEVIIGTLCAIFTTFYYINVVEKKHFKLIHILFLLLTLFPVVILSVNMVTDTITIDEYQYMDAITDMSNIRQYDAAGKMMVQYRTSQFIFGTIFSILKFVFGTSFSKTKLVIIYKILHWGIFYVLGIIISTVIYKKYLLFKNENETQRILSWIITIYVIIGLPMTISIMKVCNYDASNVMFAVLGLILVGVYVKSVYMGVYSNITYAYSGLVCCLLGCLDKWSSLPYLMIGIILFCVSNMKRTSTNIMNLLKYCILSVIFITLMALFLGWINIEYIRIFLADGNLAEKISLKHVIFTLTNMIKVAIEGSADANISDNAIIYLIVFILDYSRHSRESG